MVAAHRCLAFLVRPGPCQVLVELLDGGKDVSYLARETGMTYSYVLELLGIMEKKHHFIESKRMGKRRECYLTEEGKVVANGIGALVRSILSSQTDKHL